MGNWILSDHKVDIPLGVEAKAQAKAKLMQLIDIKK